MRLLVQVEADKSLAAEDSSGAADNPEQAADSPGSVGSSEIGDNSGAVDSSAVEQQAEQAAAVPYRQAEQAGLQAGWESQGSFQRLPQEQRLNLSLFPQHCLAELEVLESPVFVRTQRRIRHQQAWKLRMMNRLFFLP